MNNQVSNCTKYSDETRDKLLMKLYWPNFASLIKDALVREQEYSQNNIVMKFEI